MNDPKPSSKKAQERLAGLVALLLPALAATDASGQETVYSHDTTIHLGDDSSLECPPPSNPQATFSDTFTLNAEPTTLTLSFDAGGVDYTTNTVYINGLLVSAVPVGDHSCYTVTSALEVSILPFVHVGDNSITLTAGGGIGALDDIWVYNLLIVADGWSGPAFEIVSAAFDKAVYQNGVDTAHLTVVTRSNWGFGTSLPLTVDLFPNVGPPFSMGTQLVTLSPGQEVTSHFSWAVPDTSCPWEFDANITLSDGSRSPLITVPITDAFLGVACDPVVLAQAEADIYQCWLDNGSACGVGVAGSTWGWVAAAANATIFVEKMCVAGQLHRAGRWGEGWAAMGGAVVAFAKTAFAFVPVADFIRSSVDVYSKAQLANTCANTELFQRLYGGEARSRPRGSGVLVDSLANWANHALDSLSVEMADVLLVGGWSSPRVEADGSWAERDSIGLAFPWVTDVGDSGLAMWVPRHVYAFGGTEDDNPHSEALFTVTSLTTQEMNVGLVHTTSTGMRVTLRYAGATMGSGGTASIGVTEVGESFPMEVDLDGDGDIDQIYYPGGVVVEAPAGAAATVQGQLELVARPSPFSGGTAIHFGIPTAGPAHVAIYDVTGRLVRSLLDGPSPAGTRVLEWNGHGMPDHPVAPGVYFVRLQTTAGARTAKIIKIPE